MRKLGVRVGLVLALLGALVLAPGAAARSGAAETYPLVSAYHFSGTPLAVAFFDGGTAGRIAVMYEFNLKGIVPNSYAAVITWLYDIEVRADKKRHLSAVSTFPRPDALARLAGLARPELASPQPDLAQLPKLPTKNFTSEERKTFLRDYATLTSFIFFVDDTTEAEKLVSNPEVAGGTAGIPGSTAFQLSVPVFEIFPEDQDGHTHVETKQEVPQPPLTGNLDLALEPLEDAEIAEVGTQFVRNNKKDVDKLLKRAIKSLGEVRKYLHRASAAGEIAKGTAIGQEHIRDLIEDAMDLDQQAMEAPTYLVTKIRAAVRWKQQARALILKAIGRIENPSLES